jgi:hypothetical protein
LQCNPAGGAPCCFFLLCRTGHVYRDYTPGLAGRWLQDGSCAACCCRPAVEQCQPAEETDHLRHDVRPTSTCAVLQPSAPVSGKFSFACIVIQSTTILRCWQGRPIVTAPGTSQTARCCPRRDIERDLFVDRSTANDRSTRDMCYRAWPAARVAPLAVTVSPSQERCCVEEIGPA